MGEYANYRGESIKIGTCEDMYYLREDQAHLVDAQDGNVDPFNANDQKIIRFRFPWPDEDTIEPGFFEPFERSVWVPGAVLPVDFEHHSVQFVAQAGYNLCVPCPESPDTVPGLTIHRNGFSGAFHVAQQGYRGDVLALIGKCGGCGAKFNLPTWDAAEPIVIALRAEAYRMERLDGPSRAAFWYTIADRIMAGYRVTMPASGR